MKGKREILLGGVGGQGILTIGAILGEAALNEGLFACLSSSYGTEARGTFTRSDLILSDEPIDFIEVTSPDILLCLAQEAWNRLGPTCPGSTMILFDSDQITPGGINKNQARGYPITSLALESGYPQNTNLFALGILVKKTDIISPKAVEMVIAQKMGSRSSGKEKAHEAFRTGYSLI